MRAFYFIYTNFVFLLVLFKKNYKKYCQNPLKGLNHSKILQEFLQLFFIQRKKLKKRKCLKLFKHMP